MEIYIHQMRNIKSEENPENGQARAKPAFNLLTGISRENAG